MSKVQEILTAPHEEIEKIQIEGIKKTVVNCYENIPFYKKSFDEAGFDPYSMILRMRRSLPSRIFAMHTRMACLRFP